MEITGVILRLLVVSAVSVVLSVLAMLVVKWTGTDLKDMRQRTRPHVLAIAALFNLLFILAVALILKFWDHEPVRVLGFSLDGNGLVFSLAILFMSVVLALIFIWILHAGKVIRIRRFPVLDLKGSLPVGALLGFLVLFIAALQEEILFRGYFSFALRPYGFWYGLVISSIVFTLWHFLTNKAGIFQTLDWLLGGVMLFYIYWLSGSIWVAALVHFSRNFTNVLVFNISGSNSLVSYEQPVSPSFKTLFTVMYSILIMGFGYFYFG